MNFEIVLATNNKNKVREFRQILAPHKIIVYGLSDLNLEVEDIQETGDTYFENALIKAMAVQKLVSMPVIADDSGLEVEAMNNAPGIYSSRFASQYKNQQEANLAIIKNCESKTHKARFVCGIVMLNMENHPQYFEGIVEGEIATTPYGEGGFGYDPIFVCKETNKTYAEMSDEEKNKSSHRAKALKKLLTYLKIRQLSNR